MRFWKMREAEVAEEGVKESREERRGSGEREATASVPVSSRDRRAAEPDPNNVPPRFNNIYVRSDWSQFLAPSVPGGGGGNIAAAVLLPGAFVVFSQAR